MKEAARLIDFTELARWSRGEGLETMFKAILLDLGFSPSWSGRGADRGKDLSFEETLASPFGMAKRRWLIQCKDYAVSDRSVTEGDVPSIVEKCMQHGCDGFLLVVTTCPSAGLVSHLEGITNAQSNRLCATYLDYERLSGLLFRPECHRTFRTYLPDSFRRFASQGTAILFLEKLRAEGVSDPRIEQIKKILAEHEPNRLADLPAPLSAVLGSELGPQVAYHMQNNDLALVVEILDDQPYEEWQTVLALYQSHGGDLAALLREVIAESGQQDKQFDALKHLVEDHGISLDEALGIYAEIPGDDWELEFLAERFDLDTILRPALEEYVNEHSADLFSGLPPETWVDNVYLEDAEYRSPKPGSIIAKFKLSVSVTVSYDGEDASSYEFPASGVASIGGWRGCEVEDLQVDTRCFYDADE